MKKNSLITALTLLTALSLPMAAHSATTPDAPHIATSANGTVKAKADKVTLNISVNATDKDALSAKKSVDEKVAAYIDFLTANEIAKDKIDTANLYTSAQYEYVEGGKRQFKGYQASRQVMVTLTDLTKVNGLLDAALKSGLTDIRGIEFGVQNPEQYQIKARELAIKKAKDQAKALAKGFNEELGKVFSINYAVSGAHYQPVFKGLASPASLDARINESYEPQELTFSDSVDVVFELKRSFFN